MQYTRTLRLSGRYRRAISTRKEGSEDTRPEGASAVAEVSSDGGTLFDGSAKITIPQLLPRRGEK
jgi:hypothetical protein